MKKKLVIGITIPGSTPLIKGQAKYFVSRGYDVYLMCPKNEQSTKYCEEEGCNILDISIERYISPFKDVKTLIQIIAKLRKLKPDIVNVGTPKMGLLGAIGAYFVGVRVLIYTCRGLRYEHENGFKYFLLKSLERIPGLLADKIICISNSIREKAVEDGVFKMVKTVVIEKGSSNGIDLNKFDKKRISAESLNNLKKRLGVSNEFIFGFIGRLNDRKGITELYNAFSKLQNKFPSIRLIIVGKVDLKELKNKSIINQIASHSAIDWVGWQDNVPLYLSLYNVFVMPSWSEGFGNAYVEAAAMGIPIIGVNGTGSKDAVKNGYNGILISLKSEDELYNAMEKYLLDENLHRIHQQNSTKWASNFKQINIWKGQEQVYLTLLK